MNPALVIVFFFWCGGGDAFCDEGRVVHDSCTAAEAWLHAGLQPGQTLIVAACETTAGQNTQIAGAQAEEMVLPQIAARADAKGGE
jgi:hypothetical protein